MLHHEFADWQSGSIKHEVPPPAYEDNNSVFVLNGFDNEQTNLIIRMSNPTSNNTSRSASPASNPPGPGNERPRIVSGSIKDRIARFENPDAAPLRPSHPFGLAGGGQNRPSGSAQLGMIGNRIPSLDPRSAGHVAGMGMGGPRRVSENKGMIGNRIPSVTTTAPASGKAAPRTPPAGSDPASGQSSPAPDTTTAPAQATTVPAPASKSTERPGSPEGSTVSSAASNARGTTGSPSTSRSSSPPTSAGGDQLPPSLLAATLPDIGGPGAMTPSSTRAEAGEDTTDLSAPSTPVVGAQPDPQIPAPLHDLVPQNLKLAQNMQRAGSSSSAIGSFAPSVTSSLASQYDPSSQGMEEKQMMQDVSGISTPMGTPRAANRDFEGSARGEGSVMGEGSVAGDEGVVGDADFDEVKQRLNALSLGAGTAKPDIPDRDPTPEPPRETPTPDADVQMADDQRQTPSQEVPEPEAVAVVEGKGQHLPTDVEMENTASAESKDEASADATPDNTLDESKKEKYSSSHSKQNPNQASDLDALKAGDLNRASPTGFTELNHGADQNPINNLAELGMHQNLAEEEIPLEDQKEQGGMAGQRFEDVEKADKVEVPPSSGAASRTGGETTFSQGGVNVEEASEPSSTKQEKGESEAELKDGKDGKGAERSSDANFEEQFGSAEPAAMPSARANLANAGRMDPDVDDDDSGSETDPSQPPKVHGILGGTEHTDYIGPSQPSVLERIGVGQSAPAEARRQQIKEGLDEHGLLDYPGERDQMTEHAAQDKREGKTLVGELAKMAKDQGAAMQVHGQDVQVDGDGNTGSDVKDEPRAGIAIPNPFKPSATFTSKKDMPPKPKVSHGHAGDHETTLPSTAEAAVEGKKEEGGQGEDVQTKSEGSIINDNTEIMDSKDGSKPVQIQIEPAPIAQSKDEAAIDESARSPSTETETDVSSQATEHGSLPSFSPTVEKTSEADAEDVTTPTPRLPSPPHDDPDEVDPPHSARSFGTTDTGRSTPLDPSFLKSFPAVPDEEHPRIEVHISPHATPVKAAHSNTTVSTQSDTKSTTEIEESVKPPVPTKDEEVGEEGKGLKDIRRVGHNQGVSPIAMEANMGPAAEKQVEQQEASHDRAAEADANEHIEVDEKKHGHLHAGTGLGAKTDLAKVPTVKLPSLEKAMGAAVRGEGVAAGLQAPTGSSVDEDKEGKDEEPGAGVTTPKRGTRTQSDASSNLEVDTGDAADPNATVKLKKRGSTRRSPKSPLLDDEDPGDFEPGEDGWAVVTKGRDS